jgi:hypothetical protein
MPGYAACFDNLWDSGVALPLTRHARSAQAMRDLGHHGVAQWLRSQKIRFQQRTVDAVLAWAEQAPEADLAAARHLDIALELETDHAAKSRQIHALERDFAARLARTPYVPLLSMPGIHVVTASRCAAQFGPIHFYANGRALTGRAALFPSRHQSDRVDHPNGRLARCGNRAIRDTLLTIADHLMTCNRYFRARADRWKNKGVQPTLIHTRIASCFARIAIQMVAARQVFRHPCTQERSYILEKLLAFHREHDTPVTQLRADLDAAFQQLPTNA